MSVISVTLCNSGHGHGELEEEEWLSEYYSSFLHKAGASLVG